MDCANIYNKLPNTLQLLNDLEEIKHIEKINVWGQDQTVLEKQALTEIENFNIKPIDREDGELSDHEIKEKPTNYSSILDIDKYIKQQEELKKNILHKKAANVSCVSEISRNAAIKVSELNKVQKRKSKQSEIKKKKQKLEDSNISDIVAVEKHSDSDYYPSEPDSEDSDYTRKDSQTSWKTKQKYSNIDNKRVTDDGDIKCYKKRLNDYYKSLENENLLNSDDDGNADVIEVCLGFKITGKIWNNLYSLQQDSDCRFCGAEDETSEHLASNCVAIMGNRVNIFGREIVDDGEIPSLQPSQFSEFTEAFQLDREL